MNSEQRMQGLICPTDAVIIGNAEICLIKKNTHSISSQDLRVLHQRNPIRN